MKKLMFSLCALCLAGAASAQVSVPLNEKVQGIMKSSLSPLPIMQSEKQDMPNRKAEGVDSCVTQAAYNNWQGYGGAGGYMAMTEREQEAGKDPCRTLTDKIRLIYGTGGFIDWAGTGEIGYRFFAGKGSYYDLKHMYPNFGVPFAAATVLLRAPSTALAENDTMPFYFKIYNHTKVSEQRVQGSLTDFGPDDYVDVVYPTDPTQYTSLTDTIWIPSKCSAKGGIEQQIVKGEFTGVDASQRLGDNFCLSMMFPINWDATGDTVITSAWNATPMIMFQENGDEVISDDPHCVYYVFDFERTTGFFSGDRPADHKRYVGFVEDEEMQPNKRYFVAPFDSWYWSPKNGGGHTIGEPWMRLYYTNWSALQSANKADRYVNVSPVPAVDYVNFTSYTDMSRIEVYSLGGQLIKAVNVSGDEYRMDISGLNSGMYVARIYSEKGISSAKLIVR